MPYISQRNEYDVCGGADRAVIKVFLMHAVNCCSNLRCHKITQTNTHTQMFDNISIGFHPISLNQRYDDVVMQARRMIFHDDYHCLLNALALLRAVFVCPCMSL